MPWCTQGWQKIAPPVLTRKASLPLLALRATRSLPMVEVEQVAVAHQAGLDRSADVGVHFSAMAPGASRSIHSDSAMVFKRRLHQHLVRAGDDGAERHSTEYPPAASALMGWNLPESRRYSIFSMEGSSPRSARIFQSCASVLRSADHFGTACFLRESSSAGLITAGGMGSGGGSHRQAVPSSF